MRVTIKYVLSTLQKAGLKLKEIVKIYHLHIMKLLPLAPAYILIAKKSNHLRKDTVI